MYDPEKLVYIRFYGCETFSIKHPDIQKFKISSMNTLRFPKGFQMS